jgi:hypothetical protein
LKNYSEICALSSILSNMWRKPQRWNFNALEWRKGTKKRTQCSRENKRRRMQRNVKQDGLEVPAIATAACGK